MQQIDNLYPPGRFIMEDPNGADHIFSTANDANDYSHPLVRNKVWVQVSDDLAIGKIMHRLREKETTLVGGNGYTENNQTKQVVRGESEVGNEAENAPAAGDIFEAISMWNNIILLGRGMSVLDNMTICLMT